MRWTQRARSAMPGGALLLLALLAAVLSTLSADGQQRRYRDPGDGTVRDTASGLLWLADADCWGPLPWQAAKEAVAELADGGCGLMDGSKPGDWRLPTADEWRGVVDCSCGEITLKDDIGTGCYNTGASSFHRVQPTEYWSSTASSRGGWKVRVMSLHDGLEGTRTAAASLLVWPVREPLRDGG